MTTPNFFRNVDMRARNYPTIHDRMVSAMFHVNRALDAAFQAREQIAGMAASGHYPAFNEEDDSRYEELCAAVVHIGMGVRALRRANRVDNVDTFLEWLEKESAGQVGPVDSAPPSSSISGGARHERGGDE